MYKKFNEFKENKDQEKLFSRLDLICHLVKESKKSFQEVWEETILPCLVEEEFSNSLEAVDNILEYMNQGQRSNPYQIQQQQIDPSVANNFMNQDVDPVKKDFAKGIENLQRQMSQKARGNPQGANQWQASNMLYKDMINWLNNWKPTMNNLTQANQRTQQNNFQNLQVQPQGSI